MKHLGGAVGQAVASWKTLGGESQLKKWIEVPEGNGLGRPPTDSVISVPHTPQFRVPLSAFNFIDGKVTRVSETMWRQNSGNSLSLPVTYQQDNIELIWQEALERA